MSLRTEVFHNGTKVEGKKVKYGTFVILNHVSVMHLDRLIHFLL